MPNATLLNGEPGAGSFGAEKGDVATSGARVLCGEPVQLAPWHQSRSAHLTATRVPPLPRPSFAQSRALCFTSSSASSSSEVHYLGSSTHTDPSPNVCPTRALRPANLRPGPALLRNPAACGAGHQAAAHATIWEQCPCTPARCSALCLCSHVRHGLPPPLLPDPPPCRTRTRPTRRLRVDSRRDAGVANCPQGVSPAPAVPPPVAPASGRRAPTPTRSPEVTCASHRKRSPLSSLPTVW
ncbi:uncharacterized protein LOC143017468 [Oratosquilla oratoria]|uniref:uncharacterized protein LOC143017468 n=1 Tax=Oratosquilla oratoria TaxID=337810 RepID=UPI003F777A53